MNGAIVIARTASTIFIRLPPDRQRECGGCSCAYCKAHPELTPRWDTLAVALDKPAEGNDCTWTVHMPDPAQMLTAIDCGYVKGPAGITLHGGRVR